MRHRPTIMRRPFKRHTDWSGLIVNNVTLSNIELSSFNLWTPVAEDKKATVVRIVGEVILQPVIDCPSAGIIVGPGAQDLCDAHAVVDWGIQVVSRAGGIGGLERNPAFLDDLEGGEWMHLRRWMTSFNVIGASHPAVASTVIVMPGVTSQATEHVDVRVKRKLDLSQDELLVTFATPQLKLPYEFVRAWIKLRMLLQAY